MIWEQGNPGIVLDEQCGAGIVEAVLRLLKPQAWKAYCVAAATIAGRMAVLHAALYARESASACCWRGRNSLQGTPYAYLMAAGCGLPITLALTDEAFEALHFSDAMCWWMHSSARAFPARYRGGTARH
jgi:hypothetical protein